MSGRELDPDFHSATRRVSSIIELLNNEEFPSLSNDSLDFSNLEFEILLTNTTLPKSLQHTLSSIRNNKYKNASLNIDNHNISLTDGLAIISAITNEDSSAIKELSCKGCSFNPSNILSTFIKTLQHTKIKTLKLDECSIDDHDAMEIASALGSLRLTNLTLWGNKIENDGAREIVKNIPDSLEHLDLGYNIIDEQFIRSVLDNIPNSLKSLGLLGSEIYDPEAIVIAENLHRLNFTSLNLECNLIEIEGARGIARNLHQSKLTSLNLNQNGIESDGAEAISVALPHSELLTLDIAGNDIDDRGVIAIAKSLDSSKLITLNLGGNEIGFLGAREIATHLSDSQLTCLNLCKNDLRASGAREIAKHLPDSNLDTLNLFNNKIGAEGALALAEYLSDTKLSCLDLGWNNIGNEVIIQLLENIPKCLTSFNLALNKINDDGARAIATFLPGSNLTELNLYRNEISQEGAEALLNSMKNNFTLLSLNLHGNNLNQDYITKVELYLERNKIIHEKFDELYEIFLQDGVISSPEISSGEYKYFIGVVKAIASGANFKYISKINDNDELLQNFCDNIINSYFLPTHAICKNMTSSLPNGNTLPTELLTKIFEFTGLLTVTDDDRIDDDQFSIDEVIINSGAGEPAQPTAAESSNLSEEPSSRINNRKRGRMDSDEIAEEEASIEPSTKISKYSDLTTEEQEGVEGLLGLSDNHSLD